MSEKTVIDLVFSPPREFLKRTNTQNAPVANCNCRAFGVGGVHCQDAASGKNGRVSDIRDALTDTTCTAIDESDLHDRMV